VVPRLKKLEDSSGLKAVVLAAAGLNRLGLSRHVAQLLEGPGFLPAAGQGALAVECRADDVEVLDLLSAIHDKTSGEAVRAERSVLHELHGGCNAPIGILARIEAASIDLACEVFSDDGRRLISASGHKPVEQAHDLVQAILRDLRAQGAGELLEKARTDNAGRGAQPETKSQDAEFAVRSEVNAASGKLKAKSNEDTGEEEEYLRPFLMV